MAREKAFEVCWDYAHTVNGNLKTNRNITPIDYPNYLTCLNEIQQHLKNNNLQQLITTLKKEWVDEKIIKRYEKKTHDTYPPEGSIFNDDGQRDIYTVEVHRVAPLLEELVVHHKEDYQALLEQAVGECREALLDFTSLDLTDADLTSLHLQGANFSNADLRKTKGVTQELLDKAKTYEGAQLSPGLIPYWSVDKKNQVLAKLGALERYGKKLGQAYDKEGREKSQLVTQLVTKLREKINSSEKYNSAFQRDFLETLHQHDEKFNHKRYLGIKTLIANISLFILGFGIGYIAAAALHKKESGHFLFFDSTRTAQQVNAIENTIQTACVA